ncbi:MAG: ABC transporter substrate-binding protein [Tepidisphaeraceae bacterium]
MIKSLCAIVGVLVLGLGVVGCDESKSAGKDEAGPIQIQLNWKAEPQFGGFYAAREVDPSLKLDVREGGAGIATIDMAAAGTVPFAIVSGSELVVARSKGKDVVAIFAVYQDDPHGLMVPASRDVKSIDDIFKSEGTLAIERGLPYAVFLQKKYGFDKLKLVPSPYGDFTQFRTTSNYAMQVFVTSEPLSAKKLGLDARTFPVGDAGWNEYSTVLVTNRKYLSEHPDTVMQVVKAVRAGWEGYMKAPSSTNAKMGEINKAMDAATFADSAQAQEPLILTGDAMTLGVGAMTKEKWQVLVNRLVDLKLIDKPVAVDELFIDPATLK